MIFLLFQCQRKRTNKLWNHLLSDEFMTSGNVSSDFIRSIAHWRISSCFSSLTHVAWAYLNTNLSLWCEENIDESNKDQGSLQIGTRLQCHRNNGNVLLCHLQRWKICSSAQSWKDDFAQLYPSQLSLGCQIYYFIGRCLASSAHLPTHAHSPYCVFVDFSWPLCSIRRLPLYGRCYLFSFKHFY